MKQPIQMQVPAIGNQQPIFDPAQAAPIKCQACDHEVFAQAFKLSKLSHIASRNKTGQDLTIKTEVFLCVACGAEAISG